MEETLKARNGERTEFPYSLWGHCFLQSFIRPSTQKLSKPRAYGYFMVASLHRCNWLSHCCWWLNTISSPSPLPGGSGDRSVSFNLLITRLVPLPTSPHPFALQSHFIPLTKDTIMALITRNFKGFRSSVPGARRKTKYIILIIDHSITPGKNSPGEINYINTLCKNMKIWITPRNSI